MAQLQLTKETERERERTAQRQGSAFQRPVILGVLAVFCCALWGSAFPGIKIGYQLLEIPSDAQGSQIVFAGYRFFLAGLLVLIFGSLAERRLLVPSSKAVPKIVKLSMLQTVLQYTFFYLGVANTSGVKGSIIVGANSLFVILIAGLLFRQEKLTGNKILGCAAGLAGVVAANLGQGGMEFSFRLSGEGFVLCSSLSYAFSTVFMKRYSKEEDPVMLSGWQFLLGGLILTAFGFLLGGRPGNFHAASAGILISPFLSIIFFIVTTLFVNRNRWPFHVLSILMWTQVNSIIPTEMFYFTIDSGAYKPSKQPNSSSSSSPHVRRGCLEKILWQISRAGSTIKVIHPVFPAAPCPSSELAAILF